MNPWISYWGCLPGLALLKLLTLCLEEESLGLGGCSWSTPVGRTKAIRFDISHRLCCSSWIISYSAFGTLRDTSNSKGRNFREEIYKGSSFCIFYLFIKRSFRRVIYQTLFLLDIVFILEYAFRLQSKKPISQKVGEYTSGYLPVYVVQPSLELL